MFRTGFDLSSSNQVSDAAATNMRLRNSFYMIEPDEIPPNVGLVVLDGPNGNGRSAAFPLLKPVLHTGALIFIDDLTSYDFESRLGMLYNYETVSKLTDSAIHPTFSFGLFRII